MFEKHKTGIHFCATCSNIAGPLLVGRGCGEIPTQQVRGDVVNLFRVLRSDDVDTLIQKISLTPYSISEMKAAYNCSDCHIERARQFILRSHLGFGSSGNFRLSGFSRAQRPTDSNKAASWDRFPEALSQIARRLKHVAIEHEDAQNVMLRYDNPNTLHYVDPPYIMSTRDPGKDYRYELTDEAHIDLLRFLKTIKGKVILSGFAHDIYRNELNDWHMKTRKSRTMVNGDRVECIWMNFKPKQ